MELRVPARLNRDAAPADVCAAYLDALGFAPGERARLAEASSRGAHDVASAMVRLHAALAGTTAGIVKNQNAAIPATAAMAASNISLRLIVPPGLAGRMSYRKQNAAATGSQRRHASTWPSLIVSTGGIPCGNRRRSFRLPGLPL